MFFVFSRIFCCGGLLSKYYIIMIPRNQPGFKIQWKVKTLGILANLLRMDT